MRQPDFGRGIQAQQGLVAREQQVGAAAPGEDEEFLVVGVAALRQWQVNRGVAGAVRRFASVTSVRQTAVACQQGVLRRKV